VSGTGIRLLPEAMKILNLIPILFVIGCLGDRANVPISTTPIPGTNVRVCLYAPDSNGQYVYSVISNENRTHCSLGRLKADPITPVTVMDPGNGVFRIEWGSAAYAVIDAKNALTIEDSSGAAPPKP
jgi:hypothetical protein